MVLLFFLYFSEMKMNFEGNVCSLLVPENSLELFLNSVCMSLPRPNVAANVISFSSDSYSRDAFNP